MAKRKIKKLSKWPYEQYYKIGDKVRIRSLCNFEYRPVRDLELDRVLTQGVYGIITEKCPNGFCIVQVHKASNNKPIFKEAFFYEQLRKI